MQHLNPYRFYELAAKLHGLFSGNQNRVADMFAPLTETQTALDALIKGDPLPLDSARNDAVKLLNKISNLFNKYYIDPSTKQLRAPDGEDRVDPHEMAALRTLVETFEHALAADLNRASTYAACKRGIYSTHDLIENAYRVFSPSLLNAIPVATHSEFNIAGRALAFGLGTAAAMHMLRAVEMTLKQYYELFSGTTVTKSERSYGIYLKKLSALVEDENSAMRPDKRLLQMLAQIKEHYRNPLTAPESEISVEQATALFGLSSAIISLMAEGILAHEKPRGGKDLKTALANVAEAGSLDDNDESADYRLSQAS